MYTVEYTGSLQTQLTHLKSAEKVKTDPPVDNNGTGSAFSPTDLVAAGLASCMITLMAIHAQKHNLDIGKIKAHVVKSMKSDPRRIGAIEIQMEVENMGYSESDKSILWNAAVNCPVAKSLHTDIDQILEMIFTD